MEAPLEQTGHGLVVKGPGWFLVNARDVRWWRTAGAQGANFEGDTRLEQLGIGVDVLGPGEPLGAYHRENDQEGFLVLRGSGTVLLEGEEHPLRQWDYVHCPPGTAHVLVGGPIALLSIGARQHGGVEHLAPKPDEQLTYARYDGWLD